MAFGCGHQVIVSCLFLSVLGVDNCRGGFWQYSIFFGSQTCEGCAKDLQTCPICRSPIQTKIKLYFWKNFNHLCPSFFVNLLWKLQIVIGSGEVSYCCLWPKEGISSTFVHSVLALNLCTFQIFDWLFHFLLLAFMNCILMIYASSRVWEKLMDT